MQPKKLRQVQSIAGSLPTQDVDGLSMHVDALKLSIEGAQRMGASDAGESGLFSGLGHISDLEWAEQSVKETIRRCIKWAANESELLAHALRARLDE
jgi:type 1 glutamine amidotransferase